MQNNCNKPQYQYAGFWVRAAAYMIDMVIVTSALLLIRFTLFLIGPDFLQTQILFQFTVTDVFLYLLQVAYFILMTYYTHSTVGKYVMNLRVIAVNEKEDFNFINILYRETIGRFLCSFILMAGYIMTGIDKEKRGFHDFLCDTRVIYAVKVKIYPQYQAPAPVYPPMQGQPFGPSVPQGQPFGPSIPQGQPFGPSAPQGQPFGPSAPQGQPFGPSVPQGQPFGSSAPQGQSSDTPVLQEQMDYNIRENE